MALADKYSGGSGGSSKGKKKKNKVEKFLDVVSMPGVATASALKELTDAAGGWGIKNSKATGKETAKLDEASWGDFVRQFNARQGFGSYVDSGNKHIDKAAGFAGDVIGDPLNFLGGAGVVSKVPKAVSGGSKAAKSGKLVRYIGRDEQVKLLKDAGVGDELIDKVARRGTIDPDELAKANLQYALTVGVGKAKVAIPGTEGLAMKMKGLTGGATQAIADATPVGIKSLVDVTGGALAKLEHNDRNLGAVKSADFKRAAKAGEREGRALRITAEKQLNDINKVIKESNLDKAAIRTAMEGGPIVDDAVNVTAAALTKWQDDLITKAEELAGESVGRREDYLPWHVKDEVRAYLKEAEAKGWKKGKKKEGFEQRSTLRDEGATFGSAKLEGTNAAKRSQIDNEWKRLLQEKNPELLAKWQATFGDDIKFFEDDPIKLAQQYAKGMERFVKRGHTEKRIAENPLLATPIEGADEALDAAPLSPSVVAQEGLESPPVGVVDPLERVAVEGNVLTRFAQENGLLKGDVNPKKIVTKLANDKKVQREANASLQAGLVEFAGRGVAVPAWVPEALDGIALAMAPQNKNNFIKTFDWWTNRFKAYALMKPGFHVRNFMGGIFNDALYGTEIKTYDDFYKMWAKVKFKGIDSIDPADRPFWEQVDIHIRRGDNIRDASDVPTGMASGGGVLEKIGVNPKYDPTSMNNKAIEFNFDRAGDVETAVRGPLFLQAYRDTGSFELALDTVEKFHFNYDDLSLVEKKYAKRVVPFYTWTRKNFPLQLEMMVEKPVIYNRYNHFKKNMELDEEQDQNVPAYFSELLSVRSPFKSNGGDPIYLQPDLPFRDLSETLSTRGVLGSMNPILKVPAEVIAGKQLKTDIPFTGKMIEAPKTWFPIMAAIQNTPINGRAGLPKVEEKNGKFFISDSDAHKIDNTLPILSMARRAAPSEEKYQKRAMSTYLSMLAGVGTTTLTPELQKGEQYRQSKIQAALKKREKQMTPSN